MLIKGDLCLPGSWHFQYLAAAPDVALHALVKTFHLYSMEQWKYSSHHQTGRGKNDHLLVVMGRILDKQYKISYCTLKWHFSVYLHELNESTHSTFFNVSNNVEVSNWRLNSSSFIIVHGGSNNSFRCCHYEERRWKAGRCNTPWVILSADSRHIKSWGEH